MDGEWIYDFSAAKVAFWFESLIWVLAQKRALLILFILFVYSVISLDNCADYCLNGATCTLFSNLAPKCQCPLDGYNNGLGAKKGWVQFKGARCERKGKRIIFMIFFVDTLHTKLNFMKLFSKYFISVCSDNMQCCFRNKQCRIEFWSAGGRPGWTHNHVCIQEKCCTQTLEKAPGGSGGFGKLLITRC